MSPDLSHRLALIKPAFKLVEWSLMMHDIEKNYFKWSDMPKDLQKIMREGEKRLIKQRKDFKVKMDKLLALHK